MTIEQPFHIYQEQLSSIYHGLALWKPNPQGLYKQVSIGDVGYVDEGAFIRLFNVTLPWDDESNKTLGDPFYYDPLSPDSFTIRPEPFGKSDHYSRGVSREDNAHNILAKTPDQAEGVTYECRGHGALLSLPCGGLRQAVIQTKIFEEYAGEHVAGWFHWSKVRGLPIERMEDLVLIYGCTLVTSWAAVAFDDFAMGAQVSLSSRTLKNGGASFVWSNICGTVERHDSQLESLDARISCAPLNQCVFIKCIRAKPDKFWAKIFRAPAPPFNLTGAALFSSAGVACDARTLTESFSFGQKKARVHRVPAPRISNTAAARVPYQVPYHYKPYKVNYMFYGRQASVLFFISFFFLNTISVRLDTGLHVALCVIYS